jgi:hypothetical protein
MVSRLPLPPLPTQSHPRIPWRCRSSASRRWRESRIAGDGVADLLRVQQGTRPLRCQASPRHSAACTREWLGLFESGQRPGVGSVVEGVADLGEPLAADSGYGRPGDESQCRLLRPTPSGAGPCRLPMAKVLPRAKLIPILRLRILGAIIWSSKQSED